MIRRIDVRTPVGRDPRRVAGAARWWVAAVLPLVAVAGCSRSSGPEVQYVEGRVLLDGAPLGNATVGFSPDSGAGLPAFGQTDDAGVFKLTSAKGGGPLKGAVVGSYVVTVRKNRNRLEELGPQPDPADIAANEQWQAKAARASALPPESLVPQEYGTPATSPLRAKVVRGSNGGPEFTFDLSKSLKQAK